MQQRKIIPDAPLSDVESYIRHNKLSGFALFRFRFRIRKVKRATDKRLKETLLKKECFYGPFKGEFGHFLAHTLPFLTYLHKQGVKIRYCGMKLHSPFLVDEYGQSIIHEFIELRDFFGEISPRSNSTVPPADVRVKIDEFKACAEKSGLPFWNIDDDFYYWFIHRNWLLERNVTSAYRLDKFYWGKPKENAVCLFPRSKGAASSDNNGGPWDYPELIKTIQPYFEKVYVCGHPSQVLNLECSGNVEMSITADNSVILEKCSRSSLIITQHSGVNNLGEYCNTPVLIIYNGNGPIGSMQNTIRFRPYIAGNGKRELHPLSFAFTIQEVVDFVRNRPRG